MRKNTHLILALIFIAITIVPFFFTIDDIGTKCFGFRWPLHCALYSLTGQKCALCGMTRSFSSMAHLKFALAFRYHLVGPILYCFFIFAGIYHILASLKAPRPLPKRIEKTYKYLLVIIIALLIINWVLEIGVSIWNTIGT